jgi:hypothetical protein
VPVASESPDLLAELEADDWAVWLAAVLPTIATAPFAEHHVEFWEWLWAIEPDVRPEAFVGVWPRGGAKSTSAEAGVVALGARRRRRYGLYVCDTQDQADDHVGNVAGLLEGAGVEIWYPAMSERLVGKFGNSKGWRRNRIRTSTGFTLDALGLDTANRGVKLDDQRPDFLVLDDIDRHDDSPKVTRRKIDTITKSLIPAGSPDLAILAIQNLVHKDGVFARFVDGRARFLARRRVSGPIPAVRGLKTVHEGGRDLVVEGEATWAGQGLATVQDQIDAWGLSAFESEAQHAVTVVEGTLWSGPQLAQLRRSEAPDDLVRVVVGIDPSGGDGPDNDEQGIIVAARDTAGRGWALEDASCSLPPRGWGDLAVDRYLDWDADAFVVEANFGGDMCIDVLRSAIERRAGGPVRSEAKETIASGRRVTMRTKIGDFVVHVVHASRGKRARAEPVAALAGRPDDEATWSTSQVHHVGAMAALEDEMTTWRADSPWSPNRLDAYVWAMSDLLTVAPAKRRRQIVAAA